MLIWALKFAIEVVSIVALGMFYSDHQVSAILLICLRILENKINIQSMSQELRALKDEMRDLRRTSATEKVDIN